MSDDSDEKKSTDSFTYQPCDGNGGCFIQTDCEGGYEQLECSHGCQLLECKNYKHCNQKRPKWIWEIHNKMCVNCAVQEYDGTIQFTDIKQECPVCYDEKYMMKLSCKHYICLYCLYGMFERNENIREITPIAERTKCPICRDIIDKS